MLARAAARREGRSPHFGQGRPLWLMEQRMGMMHGAFDFG